ncbi:MAG: META domain-containing protein [Candidatus Limnocylindria bacterium]
MRATHRTLAIGALALLLAACSLIPGAVNASLDGEWRLQAGTNQGAAIPIPAARSITLKIDGADVGGTSACNHYGGTLEINGATIKISALSMTEMACQDDLMAAEAAYLAALPRVTMAARDGDSLVLSGPNVELHFTRVQPVPNADLIGPLWTLESLISGEVVSSVAANPATLQFNANGILAASTGCRAVTGRYTVSGNKVKVTLDPYDLIGCADPLGAQDTQVLRVLGGVDGFTVAIQGNSMTLTAGDQGLGYRVGAAGS